MRNKSDKLPKSKKIIAAVFLMIAVIFISFLCIERRVKKYSAEMGEYYCRNQLSQSISESVSNVLNNTDAGYSDLTADIYDENGRFVTSEICAKNVNILQSMIIAEVNKNIAGLAESEIKISAGTLSGIYLLNGYGPEIRFRLVPIGSVQTELNSSFEAAGINQICHRISIDITAEVSTVYPCGAENISLSMSCILAENIISGEVPDGIIGSVSH